MDLSLLCQARFQNRNFKLGPLAQFLYMLVFGNQRFPDVTGPFCFPKINWIPLNRGGGWVFLVFFVGPNPHFKEFLVFFSARSKIAGVLPFLFGFWFFVFSFPSSPPAGWKKPF